MALNQFSRTQLLLGQESMDLLADATVAVFGIGGVGGYTVEALARSGVGHFVLVDDDKSLPDQYQPSDYCDEKQCRKI